MSRNLQTLQEFETLCAQATIRSEDAGLFEQVIRSVETSLGLESQRELAALMRVSPASVTRYAQGKSAPNPLMRPVFYGLLRDEARRRMDALVAEERAREERRLRAEANARRGAAALEVRVRRTAASSPAGREIAMRADRSDD